MVDISVIGGGPAGLSAALNSKIMGKSVALLSTGPDNLSRAKRVDNYLGFNAIEGATLMNYFYKHLAQHDIYPDPLRITSIIPFLNEYFMIGAGDKVIKSKTVILATGIQRKNYVPGESKFIGHGVSYCSTCDGALYIGRKAVVWGFSHEAAHEANFLSKIGVEVTFVSKPEYQMGLDDSIERFDGKILSICGDKNVEYVNLDSVTIDTEAVFILRENIYVQNLISSLEMSGNYIKVNNDMMTNINGIFAAGDCIGKPFQAIKAMSDGLIAAQSAANYIDKINLGR